MQPFRRYLTYEYIPEVNALHVGYQNIFLDTASDVDDFWEELVALITKGEEEHGRVWLLMWFVWLYFSFEGGTALFNRVAGWYHRYLGIVRYTTGRARLDKRLSLLGELMRHQIQANLMASKEEAILRLRLLQKKKE